MLPTISVNESLPAQQSDSRRLFLQAANFARRLGFHAGNLSCTVTHANSATVKFQRHCACATRIAALCAIVMMAISAANAQSQNVVEILGLAEPEVSAGDHAIAKLDPESEDLGGGGLPNRETQGKRASATAHSSSIESVVENVQYRLQSNEDAHAYLDRQLSSIEITQRAIVESLDQMSGSTLADILSRLSVLEHKLTDIAGELIRPESANGQDKRVRPPFALIAIDLWHSKWNAVISLEGRLAMLAPGEIRTGWRLMSIDPTKRTAQFQHTLSKHDIILEVAQ